MNLTWRQIFLRKLQFAVKYLIISIMLRRAVTITNVTLATKDETSRGVAKACLLSVADVGTILQVVVKPRKPR